MSPHPPERQRPKRSLSQNFLIDPNLRRKIIRALEPASADTVLEIGAGHGELGELLVGRVARLVLVEKDDRLAAGLTERFAAESAATVVHGDALELDLEALLRPGRPYRVLSNLPYAITTPLLFRILDLRPPAERIVVTVQREVAERIVAGPGTKTYGALSVGVQIRGTPRVAFGVSRTAFRPVPDVDSAAVVIEPDPRPPSPEEEEQVRRLTRITFAQRRKQLQKILRTAPEYSLSSEAITRLSADIGFDPRARPERLSPAEFRALARALPVPVEKRTRPR